MAKPIYHTNISCIKTDDNPTESNHVDSPMKQRALETKILQHEEWYISILKVINDNQRKLDEE